jgi:hypothetical protein
MPAIVVLGAQWGDEGKGKATDLLATTEQCVRRIRRADSRASSSAVPASSLVITSSGSTGRTLAHAPARPVLPVG